MWFQNARAKFRRNLSKQQQQQQQVLAYVADPMSSSPPTAGCPLQAPWDPRRTAVTSSFAATAVDDDDDHALRHVTNPDFQYARRDVIGAYERSAATQCRDCCSVEMGFAAENSSHAHHYQQLYQ